jgi:nucleoside-diphosphate-sugar epimerase
MPASQRNTVLVVGGSGFLGRAIGAALSTAGFEVHVTWRNTRPPEGLPHHRVSVDRFDEIDRLLGTVDPGVVVNALGGPHRPQTPQEIDAAWRDSPAATSALLEACRRRDLRFVHLASSHEYRPSDRPHHESSPLGPVSLRGIAALAATSAVRLWAAETGSPTVILRPFSVYGPGEPADRVIPTLLRAAVTGTPFATTPQCSKRDFVFVDDIAEAVVMASGDSDLTGEFNLGTGIGTSVDDLIVLVQEVTGRVVTRLEGRFEPRPGDRPSWVADPGRAAATLGWKAETALADGLRRCSR